MTTFDRFDPFEQRITAAIDEIAAPRRPDYLEDILRQTARTSQRPRWRLLVTHSAGPISSQRGHRVRLALLLGLLIVGMIAAALLAGSRPPPARLVLGVFDPPVPAAADPGTRLVRLPDGRTFVFRMGDGGSSLRVGVVDPTTGRILEAGSTIATPETVAALADGGVLVLGQPAIGGPRWSAEIFDPEAGRSTLVARPGGTLVSPVPLPDGRFVIFDAGLGRVWIVNPADGSEVRAEHPPFDGYVGASLELADGRVLLIQDFNEGMRTPALPVRQAVAIFDPATLRYTSVAPLPAARMGVSTTLLPDGTVLVAGGAAADPTASDATPSSMAWRFDPATGAFASTGPMLRPRWMHGASLMADGRVLIAG
ncbi:MAG: kelch motif-containing protein, partial [Chloroflexi bacterium]|nr:kelch motif-containing protein [Chloroflexota bacterium]